MRVLMIHTDYSKGGAARIAYSLHEYMLNRPGIDPIFLSGRGSGVLRQNIMALGQSRLHEYANALAYRIFATEGIFSNTLWKKIIAQDFFQSDIIHLHNVHGYYLSSSVLEAIKQYCVVWTLHDFWMVTGRCTFPLECRGWERSCEHCPYLARYPSTWLRRNYSKDFTRKHQLLNEFSKLVIVVPSNSFDKQLSCFGATIKNSKVIHNGVDINVFKPLNNSLEKEIIMSKVKIQQDERPILCFIARKLDEPRKGFDIFYKSISNLDKKIRLILIGGISKKIHTLKFPDSIDVIYAGHINDKSLLSDYIKISDILVNPSKEETFGLTALEGLSCGTIPVVFNLPIFQETLGDWAIFSELMNPYSLKNAILRALDNKLSFQEKKNAYAYICNNFSLEKMCKSYIELYKEL